MKEIAEIQAFYSLNCWPTAIEPLGFAGGLSGARFWRVVAPCGLLALRCWPMEHPTQDGLRFIHTVLQHAQSRGMKILPVPIATTDGATFVHQSGHLWELAPWLPGTADYEKSPRLEKLRAAMRTLADFHLAIADFPASPSPAACGLAHTPAPAITHRLARLRELQAGGIESLANAITDTTWPDLAPLARQFVAALPNIVPPAIARLAPLADVPLPLQPCIRDIWHDHVLFEGDTVTGLIDFGAMQIDTPATDVARLLGSLVGNDEAGWREGLAAYGTVRPLSDQESLAVFALDRSGTLLAISNWIRWIYLDRRGFENQQQVIARFLQLLERIG